MQKASECRSPSRTWFRDGADHVVAKYDYPPDLEQRTVEMVLEQAELFAAGAEDN